MEAQSEQLRVALASAKTDTRNKSSSERTLDGNTAQANPPKTELEDALDKLDLADQEISRLKQLVQQWQKYGMEWKRDAQSARVRASELELQLRETALSAQVKAAEESRALLETERKETQRLTSTLADQTVCSPYFLRHVAIPMTFFARQQWSTNVLLVKSLRNEFKILRPWSHSSELNYHPSSLPPLTLGKTKPHWGHRTRQNLRL